MAYNSVTYSNKVFYTPKNRLVIDIVFMRSREADPVKDVVHFQVFDNNDKNKSVKMKLDLFKLRQLCAAIGDSLRNVESYKNFKLHTNSDSGKKGLWVGRQADSIYINIENETHSIKLEQLFNIYEAKAFLSTYAALCDHFDVMYAKTQLKTLNNI